MNAPTNPSASTRDAFQPAERFHGYVVERLLGRGGIGAVYLVRHEVLDTYFALKVLYPDVVSQDKTYVRRFLREARLATRIRHPNLVSVHDCGYDEAKDLYYLVMDYVTGGSLREALAFEGRFDIPRAVGIVAQVAEALRAAQEYNVVHRDIKPDNIMIQPDGLVKLVDLGIAKAQDLGDSVMTNTDSVFGTPAYISPEQARCSANVDARADIYSLGIVFYEMVAGKCPYEGRNAAQIIGQILCDDPAPDVRDARPDVPAPVATFIRRMVVKDLDRRFPTFDAVLEELARLGYGTVAQPRPSPVQIAPSPAPGMKTLLSGLGATESAAPATSARASAGPATKVAWLFVIAVAVLAAVLVALIAFG